MHGRTSETSQRTSQSRRRDCERRCDPAHWTNPALSLLSAPYPPSCWRAIQTQYMKVLRCSRFTSLWRARPPPHSFPAHVQRRLHCGKRPEQNKECCRRLQKWWTNLVQTYATDDLIAEADVAFTRYNQPWTMSPTQCAKALVTKSVRCGEVQNEYVLGGIFIKLLHEQVRHCMRSYWTTPRVSV